VHSLLVIESTLPRVRKYEEMTEHSEASGSVRVSSWDM
jgi:hypothetical protein